MSLSIFKITSSVPSGTTVTVRHTNFGDHYVGINASTAWQEVTPVIRQSIERHVLPYIGDTFYQALVALYNGTNPIPANLQGILTALQDAAAHYAMYTIMPIKNITVGSAGVVMPLPDGGATTPPQWAYREKTIAALNDGDQALDRALQLMEQGAKAGVALCVAWATTDEYKKSRSAFIASTDEMDEFLNIQRSRRSFISIVRYCRQVEERIKATLCEDLYDALFVTNVTTANQALLPMIKKAVVYLGAAEALPHHRVLIDGDGFRFGSSTDGFDDRRNSTNNIHQASVDALRTRFEQLGAQAMSDLVRFLEKNIDTYPTYRDSECRQVVPDTSHSIVISERGGVVGLF